MPITKVVAGLRRTVRAAVTGELSGATAPKAHHAVHWGTVLAVLLGVTGLIHLLEGNAALLGYRTLYYLIPLLMAVVTYLILEKRARALRRQAGPTLDKH